MFSHITVGVGDLLKGRRFYDAVLAPLGVAATPVSDPSFVGYGKDGKRVMPFVSICTPFDGNPPSHGNGFHIAWVADSEDAVRAFHAAALDHGGTSEGPPGTRLLYASDYFAAYVRDPDGNKLQAVYYADGRVPGPGGDVLSHVTVGSDDLERDGAFYAAALEPLGLVRVEDEETVGEDRGFAVAGSQLPILFVQTPWDRSKPASPGNGEHVAFTAPTREAVDAFHAAALSNGGTDEGKPGLRPHYGPTYYAAYVRDPSGNKLQAVCREG